VPIPPGNESVGAVEHGLFALVRVLDDDHFLRGGQGVLLADEKAGDNSGHIAACRQRRARQAAHQAVASAAVDEADSLGCLQVCPHHV
jgi:hypothetical protein